MSRPYATFQHIGSRSHQCDATAVDTCAQRRAYVLLDGIGSDDAVREWTRERARSLASVAVQAVDVEAAVRRFHGAIARTRYHLSASGWWGDMPCAVAVVAVETPDRDLHVVWCGDARAYLYVYAAGGARLLTVDHNVRQERLDAGLVPGRYDRNRVTSCLGEDTDSPQIGSVTVPLDPGARLLLASDGAYEPIEDAGRHISSFLYAAPPAVCAEVLVTTAIDLADSDAADNASALVADLGTPI